MGDKGNNQRKNAHGLESMWSASYVALLCVNFFQAFGGQFAMTAIPLYARDLGMDATVIGAIVSSFAITALLIRPFSGPAFDAFPKKRLYFLAYAVNAVAMFSYAFASTPQALFAVRLIHGVGIGCAAPLGMALVSRVVPASRLSSGVSIYMLAFTLAQSIGPAIAVWMVGSIGYFTTFIIAGISLSIACCIVPFVKVAPETNLLPYKIRLDRIFAKQAFVPAVLLGLCGCAFSCTGSFLILYGTIMGVEGVGLYFTVLAICLLATRPIFGRLADTYGSKVVLIPGFVAFAASFVVLSQTTSLPGFLLAAVIGSCGFGVCSPLIQALAMKMVPASHTGACTNTTYTGLDIGNLLGPAVAGALIDAFIPMAASEAMAYSWMWLCMIIPIVLAFVLYLSQVKRMDAYARKAASESRGA